MADVIPSLPVDLTRIGATGESDQETDGGTVQEGSHVHMASSPCSCSLNLDRLVVTHL